MRSLFLSFSLLFSHSFLHPLSLITNPSRARARARALAFGIRGGVEIRADSQSLAVRFPTWLESVALTEIKISDDDDDGDDGNGDVMPSVDVSRSWSTLRFAVAPRNVDRQFDIR